MSVRWTVEDPVDETGSVGVTRLRLRHCVASGAVGAAALVAVWAVFDPVVGFVEPWVVDHWIWLLLPAFCYVFGFLARRYVRGGQFFAIYDFRFVPKSTHIVEMNRISGNFIGTLFGILVCFEVDGSIGLWNSITRAYPGGIIGIVASIFVAFGLAFALRRWEYPQLNWSRVTQMFLWTMSVATVLCGVVAIAISSGLWANGMSVAISVGKEAWPAVALTVAVVAQLIWWARYPGIGARDGSTPKRLAVLAAVGLIDFLLLMYTILYWLPGIVVDPVGLSRSEAATALARERQTLLAITAAVGAGLTIIYTHLRHQLDRDANATGRYAEAVQQLGSESMSIRLGGVYALGRVAKDSNGDRETIFQLLASFVKDRGGTAQSPHSNRLALDVIAALQLLGESWLRGNGGSRPVELRGWAMEAAQLPEVRFPPGTDMTRANLNGANLRGSSLDEAIISSASLGGVSLQDASIMRSFGESVDMSSANVRNATFSESRLPEVDMRGARGEMLQANGAFMAGADFAGADLSFAEFQHADLSLSRFDGAILVGANLSHANLDGATFLKADLDHAILIGQDVDGLRAEGASGVRDIFASEEDYPWGSAMRLREYVERRINLSPANATPADVVSDHAED